MRTCRQRVAGHLQGVLKDLRKLWGPRYNYERGDPELGAREDYGLSFDYVGPGTFSDQREGYFRYQLSWGGPSDEFRFFVSGPDYDVYRVEYWFLDWYDGAGLTLAGEDEKLLLTVFEDFKELGVVDNEYMKWKEG